MGWTFFFMFVVLKIPLVAACALIWWAVREQPAPCADEDAQGPDGGGDHPRPRRPRPPRRGPHADHIPSPPPRVRIGRRRADRVQP